MKSKIVFLIFLTSFLLACTSFKEKNQQNQTVRDYFLNGQHFFENDELVQAEIQFRKVLDINPEYTPALNGLAQIALKRGNLTKAESWLSKIPESSVNWPPAKLSQAQLLFYQAEYGRSLQVLNKLEPELKRLQLDSLITELEILKLRNLLKLNRWQEAAIIFNHLQLNGQLNDPHLQNSVAMAQKIEKVMEQTPEEFRPLLFKKVVSRAEMALLIETFFPNIRTLPEPVWRFDPEISENKIKDLPANNPQAQAIGHLLKLHILWAYPDQRFYPKEYVNLGEFTIVLYRLTLAQDTEKWTELLENSDNPWPLPRARRLVKKLHLISDDEPFDQNKKVSGFMMLNALLKLKEVLSPPKN